MGYKNSLDTDDDTDDNDLRSTAANTYLFHWKTLKFKNIQKSDVNKV